MKATAITSELQRMFPLDWRMKRSYRLPTNDPSQPYYIRWSGAPRPVGEGWEGKGFADDGVLEVGPYRNPVTLSQYALTQYERAVEGDTTAVTRFLAHADWLLRAQRADGGYVYPLELPNYGARAGWISGMAQGEAASVLLRAAVMTRKPEYLDGGRRALSMLARDIKDGGASFLRDGHVFFEEVAVDPACHILNGHLYAAFALWEYVAHGFVRHDLMTLHHDAVRTLRAWLPQYDRQTWSCYDLAADAYGRPHYAPLWYHEFHIAQLRVYAAMTGIREFAEMAERWNDGLGDANVRRRVWSYSAQSLAHTLARRLRRHPAAPFRPIARETSLV